MYMHFNPVIGEDIAEHFRLIFMGQNKVCIVNQYDRLVGFSVNHLQGTVDVDFYNFTRKIVNAESFSEVFAEKSIHFQFTVRFIKHVFTMSGTKIYRIVLEIDTSEVPESKISTVITHITVSINQEVLMRSLEEMADTKVTPCAACNKEQNT